MLGRIALGRVAPSNRAVVRGGQVGVLQAIRITQPVQKRNFSNLLCNKPTHLAGRFSSIQVRYSSTDAKDTATNVPTWDTPTTLAENPLEPTTSFVNEPVTTLNPATIVDTTSAASSTAVDAITPHTGSVFSPLVNFTSEALNLIHTTTGLPWWATIVAATFTIRLALFPVMLGVLRTTAKMQALKPQMDALMAKARENTESAMSAQAELMSFMRSNGISPLSPLKNAIVQAPIFILFFGTLRNMAENYPSLHTGGTLWFTDLTVPDPYYMLPVITAGLFIGTMELGADGVATQQGAVIKMVMRILGIAVIPFTIQFPAALTLYWTANSTYSILQTIVLKNKKLRKRLRLADIPAPVAEGPKVDIPTVTFASKPKPKVDSAPTSAPTPDTFTSTEQPSINRRRFRRGANK